MSRSAHSPVPDDTPKADNLKLMSKLIPTIYFDNIKSQRARQMDETVPKMVSRNVAIALGIICIVLVASLAGTILVLNGANQQNTKRAR